jgi:hypothetical protein
MTDAEPEPEANESHEGVLDMGSFPNESSTNLELLADFQALAGGNECADCCRANPTWASSNNGALICLQVHPPPLHACACRPPARRPALPPATPAPARTIGAWHRLPSYTLHPRSV